MKNIKLIAACALLVSVSAAFGNENMPHHAATPATQQQPKEQQAWGVAGDASAVQRTLTLQMDDNMRFSPSNIQVHVGETLRLHVVNQGKVMHEIVLGTPATLQAHAQKMQQHPGMAHDAPHMAHVSPGGQGDVIWHFNRPGQFDFACLIPGHYQAGMTGTITVLAASH